MVALPEREEVCCSRGGKMVEPLLEKVEVVAVGDVWKYENNLERKGV